MLHCGDGIRLVMSSARCSPHIPLRIKTKKFDLGLFRQEFYFSESESLSGGFFFWQTWCRLLCLLLSGETSGDPLCHRALTGAGLSLELCQSDLWVFLYLSYQGPSPPVAQSGQTASSRRSPSRPKLLPLKDYGGQCALGNLKCNINFLSPWQDLCLATILSLSSSASSCNGQKNWTALELNLKSVTANSQSVFSWQYWVLCVHERGKNVELVPANGCTMTKWKIGYFLYTFCILYFLLCLCSLKARPHNSQQ